MKVLHYLLAAALLAAVAGRGEPVSAATASPAAAPAPNARVAR